MRNLNLDHLQAFVAVVERGSFSAAADQLHLTQPAVSLRILQLEKNLGVTLIERVGRRPQPTAAGAELMAHVGAIDTAVTTAVEAVGQYTGTTTGRIRLGTGATACIYLLPPLLKDLRRTYPRLEITVTTANTDDIVTAIMENRLDIGLVTLPVSGRSLEIIPTVKDEFLLVAPPDMKLPARITPGALSDTPVLLFEQGANTRRIIDKWFAHKDIKPVPIMALGNVEAIKELVAAGLGCGIIPALALRREQKRDDIIIRPLAPQLYRQLAVVIRRDKRLTAGLKHLLHILSILPNQDGRRANSVSRA